ncbi:E3 ubiquitin-protein ligase RFWD3-like isoform X2 [Panicum hallii]|uniref:E3 ubiquitin-protein ligase RFWD3-like isoform X2 n=1 Tax=Panicum hallii TaxID=206008 RepID=UPI000DF4D385|nr:E3 ubiquitin-protein ligase RFWD3-like isoform X2 [Panicum hallii]
MPPSAEFHTDAGSESESEFEDDGIETDDDGGAGSDSEEFEDDDDVETDDDEGAGSESSEDGDEMDDDEGAGEGHGRAGARVPAAAGGDGGVGEGRPPPACCVCMEPWTCSGAHRICCIPCGHVYGRSCLERWLQRCGNRSAKCPQCGERFKLKHITNLYAPGNLWDGCCHIQKLYQKQLDHAVGAMVKTFVSTKEQMKKMAEQNATPMDLIEFMEQSYTQLPIPSRPPEDGASEGTSE